MSDIEQVFIKPEYDLYPEIKVELQVHYDEGQKHSSCDVDVDAKRERSENTSEITEEKKFVRQENDEEKNECGSETTDRLPSKHSEATRQFPCHICGANFNSISEVSLHLNKHVRKTFPCPHCSCLFNFKSDYDNHQLVHSTDQESLHNQLVHSNEPESLHNCNVCGEKCATMELLEAHLEEHQEKDGIPCFIILKGQVAKRHHTPRRSTIQPYNCEECGKELPSYWCYKQHMKFHTGDTLPCSFCGKQFCTLSKLKTHLASHSEKQQECKICHKRFSREQGLKVHMTLHTGEKNYICTTCPKAFRTPFELKSHSRVHDKDKPKPFKCSECESKFVSNGQLKSHYVSKHSTETPFACEACNAKFKSKKIWKNHMMKHSEEKPYKCNICSKGFPMKYILSKHMRSHTDERPYPCQHCEKSFRYRSNLRVHMGYFHKDKVVKKAQNDDETV